MAAIFFPILLGLMAFVASGIALWFPGSLLFVPLFGVGLLPAFVLLPSLVMGGFVAGRKTRTGRRNLKVGMGAVVGAISISSVFLVGHSSLLPWLYVLMVFGGAAFGALGAFVSGKVNNAL